MGKQLIHNNNDNDEIVRNYVITSVLCVFYCHHSCLLLSSLLLRVHVTRFCSLAISAREKRIKKLCALLSLCGVRERTTESEVTQTKKGLKKVNTK